MAKSDEPVRCVQIVLPRKMTFTSGGSSGFPNTIADIYMQQSFTRDAWSQLLGSLSSGVQSVAYLLALQESLHTTKVNARSEIERELDWSLVVDARAAKALPQAMRLLDGILTQVRQVELEA